MPRLVAITAAKADTRIFIRGDKDLSYGRVMQVMATTTAAGFTKVALITEAAEGAESAKKGENRKTGKQKQ